MGDRIWYLKPCPNCGEELEIYITWELLYENDEDFFVTCQKCKKKYLVDIIEEIRLGEIVNE